MIYGDIEKLISDREYEDAIILDIFNAVTADGALKDAHEFILWGIQNKNKNVVEYALDHYWTGLQQGCFGVREVEVIYSLDDWNSTKRFYKRISKEFSEG